MDQLKIMENSSGNIDVINGGNGGFWTNERHLDFLSSMETTFVRTVLENKRSSSTKYKYNAHSHCLRHPRLLQRRRSSINDNLRLDRFVPDISESTLDLHTSKKTTSGSEQVDVSDPVHIIRSSRQRERAPAHPYKVSHDQVVPQLKDKAGDKDDQDHNH